MNFGSRPEPTLLILTALAAGAQHGCGIMADVADISGGRARLRAGALYAALDRLAAERLVEADREEIAEGRLRRYYRLTPAGGRRLEAEAGRLRADRWRDTLARTSLVLPLLVAAAALTQLAMYAPGGQQPVLARWLAPHLYLIARSGPVWWPLVPLAAIAVPAVLGWRPGTTAVTLVLSGLTASQVGSDVLNAHRGIEPSLIRPDTALWLAVLAIEALALAVSPGPRRGRALLSRPHYLLITTAGVAIGAAGTVGQWDRRLVHDGYSVAFGSPWPALVLGGLVTAISAAHADPARRQPPPAGDAGPPGLLLRPRRSLRHFHRARPVACLPAAAGVLAAGRDPDDPALVPPPPRARRRPGRLTFMPLN
ncbi:MAG: PadR family transcriptional regulator [Streptosporangiaceae bacterium]